MSFKFQVVAAPLAGISTRAYRDIVRGMGAELAYGEMVSAQAAVYGNKKTFELMDLEGEHPPRLVQLFGSDPGHIGEAAQIAAALGAQYLDLNMGCPVSKVVKNNEGCALMRQAKLAARLVMAAAAAGLPVSVKIRAGWNSQEGDAVAFARRMEEAGVAFLAVHARTCDQFYTDRADWRVIARIKEAVAVPVIGNGDIFSAADAWQMRSETGCDAVMVGRGMLGNPWIFTDIQAAFAGKRPPGRPAPPLIVVQALSHLHEEIRRRQFWLVRREGEDNEAVRRRGEKLAVQAMRNHLGWYIKGLPHAAALRRRINTLVSYEEIAVLFGEYLATEARHRAPPS